MKYTSEAIEKVVEAFSSLPTIGRKTAQRLTYHLLKQDELFLNNFSEALLELKTNVNFCNSCFNYTEDEICSICASNKRDKKIICVVQEPNDLFAVEKTNEFFGQYHVLHGLLNPLEGISPEDLKIKELIARLSQIEEVILALSPTVEGEVTSQYLSQLIKPLNIKISKIASGIPMGSSLEFSDEATLSRAIESRIQVL